MFEDYPPIGYFRKGDLVMCIKESLSHPSYNLPFNTVFVVSNTDTSKLANKTTAIYLEGNVMGYSANRFIKISKLKLLKII